MEDVTQALYMAFSIFVFVMAVTLAMYMFSVVSSTSETLALYDDKTLYYDNILLQVDDKYGDIDIQTGLVRIVGSETIIPTLYRYYKENFCVKIYDDSNNLIQIFDVNTEGLVNKAVKNTLAKSGTTDPDLIRDYAYKMIYNNHNDINNPNVSGYDLFGAPWLGSTEAVKSRIDMFINGEKGYINNVYVDYSKTQNSKFSKAVKKNVQFKERFISYSFDGSTVTNEEGDTLVTGNKSKDKVVIIYTALDKIE